MSIQDLAGNPLNTQISPMIGWVPPDSLTSEDLSLRIYLFILETIRIEDQNNGDQFLERFLKGAQAEWARTRERILSLPSLSNVVDIEDEFLPFLKWIVGWTSELDNITDALDDATLRRLISASVPFWKTRGPEDAIKDIMRLTMGVRMRIWNWFDFRIVADETAMGEEHQGFDPWMISLPGQPDDDENRYNIRIVDNGTLNRALVRDLARLTRPGNEVAEISYIGFLDLFDVDDDSSQWTDEPDPQGMGGSPTASAVTGGAIRLTQAATFEDVYVSIPGAEDWFDYVVTWRVMGQAQSCRFYRTSHVDFYDVQFQTGANTIILRKVVAGAVTSLESFSMSDISIALSNATFYAIRVEATPEAGQTRIRVYFDANLIIDVLDASHAQGSIGVAKQGGGSHFVVLDEVELFFNPLISDTIDLND